MLNNVKACEGCLYNMREGNNLCTSCTDCSECNKLVKGRCICNKMLVSSCKECPYKEVIKK